MLSSPLPSLPRLYSSPSQSSASASKQQKIPISLSQLYKNVQTLPEGVRECLVPKEDLFVELNKPVHVSPWQKASAALKKLSFRHPFGVTLKNMVSAWNSPPKQRLKAVKIALLTSGKSFDKRNNEYLKEALRMGNQPLFLALLKKAANPDLAPLIKRAVIDGNETVFSEIVKKADKPLPKETMTWLAEYGKPGKLALLLGKMPADSYTSEELQTWMFLAESQRVKIEQAKKQDFMSSYNKVVQAVNNINEKIFITQKLQNPNGMDQQEILSLRDNLRNFLEYEMENRLNFMAYSQHVNVSRVLQEKYLNTLRKALHFNDNASQEVIVPPTTPGPTSKKSLELLLDIPGFRLVDSSAFCLPVKAAGDGNLEALQLLLDTPGMGVNQMYNSQSSLHAAAKMGHAHIVEYLLSRIGIDIKRENFHQETALDIAKKNNHPAIVELLESHKAK